MSHRPPLLSLFAGSLLSVSLASGQVPGSHRASPASPPERAPGLWWGDFDADGRLDAFVTHQDGSGRLLQGVRGGGFEDVTERSGLSDVRGAHMAPWGDVDCDGRLDLYLPSTRGASRLFRQARPGEFIESGEASGLPRYCAPIDATWRDIDQDGDLDLHLVTELDDLVYANDGEGHFTKVDLGLRARSAVESRVGPSSVEGALPPLGMPPRGRGPALRPRGRVSASMSSARSASRIRRIPRTACSPRALRRWACSSPCRRISSSRPARVKWESARSIRPIGWM